MLKLTKYVPLAQHMSCVAQVDAYCYSGSCKTRASQCQLWWGPTVGDANSNCYSLCNVEGRDFGNCGIDSATGSYTACSSRFWDVSLAMLQNLLKAAKFDNVSNLWSLNLTEEASRLDDVSGSSFDTLKITFKIVLSRCLWFWFMMNYMQWKTAGNWQLLLQCS